MDERQKEQPAEPQVKQEPDNSEKLKEMEEALKNQKDEHNALAVTQWKEPLHKKEKKEKKSHHYFYFW